jgi:hypothetical protein
MSLGIPVLVLSLPCVLGAPGHAPAGDLPDILARVKSVGPEGAGNAQASAASRELCDRGPQDLLDVLRAMDRAGPIAANWLRSAVDAIAEKALADGRPLPARGLEDFVLERSHDGPVRRLAYEWLLRVDPSASDRLVPGMLDDPAVELRRDAVARELDLAEKLLDGGKKDDARSALERLLPASRDEDQVSRIAKRIEELGGKVDLARHFGFIREWRIVGPFDGSAGIGYATAYPPETTSPDALDLERAEYSGKSGPMRWVEHATPDPGGVVDLNKALGKHMGVVAYGAARIRSSEERPVSVRAGTPNALKIWLNGRLVFTREEYHHGSAMDQHRADGVLRKGENLILIKVCQNEQTDDWAQSWSFQLRVCDLTGGGLP